uniref:Uncharacterized protein n=1 Tax=Megaselia scalaris TaxID=36166 RepID=T1GLD1_MEGSC
MEIAGLEKQTGPRVADGGTLISLYRGGSIQDLRRIFSDYKAEITVLQELKWLGKDELIDKSTYHCDVAPSGKIQV